MFRLQARTGPWVKFGLEKNTQHRRPGLLEIFKQAGIDNKILGVYEVDSLLLRVSMPPAG